jgi:uroporphyrin-III C-methyltransferase
MQKLVTRIKFMFQAAPMPKDQTATDNLTPEIEKGSVWLVGAGPGDPGLLTLHALAALQQADIVVHDALVSDDILAMVSNTAIIESVGKRGGKPSPKQSEISQRLVNLAGQGMRVVRLKGGDPFVFGRGAEEVLLLAKNNIPFRVVPGITAGIGGLAYAGIPLTHGALNQAVTFLTGHDPSGKIPEGINWQALAVSSQVLVLYMAIRNMPAIAAKLIECGRNAAESVAFVRNATLPNQHVVETTLAEVGIVVEKKRVASPSIVVIGPVVSLRSTLDWIESSKSQDQV